jgi:hypothetical protein
MPRSILRLLLWDHTPENSQWPRVPIARRYTNMTWQHGRLDSSSSAVFFLAQSSQLYVVHQLIEKLAETGGIAVYVLEN